MLFSPEPKSRREDLFDFKYELSNLVNALRGVDRLIVVTGLRRTGKTSLMRVALNESGVHYLYIDVRLSVYANYWDLMNLIIKSLNDFVSRELSIFDKIRNVFKGLSGIEITLKPPSVRVKFRGRERLNIGDLFVKLNEISEPVVVAFDEAQELRKVNWLRFDRLFAYVYDNLLNIKLLLSGSQVGLLYDFLGVNNPSAPLFGRAYFEVRTRRLSPDEALEFLERGFNEVGIKCPGNLMKRAVDAFDGIIGWLTYFGYSYSVNNLRDFDEILRAASLLALDELKNLVSTFKSTRYAIILRTLAQGPAPWRVIKHRLEDYEGRSINPATVSQLLSTLVKLGIIEERDGEYVISDPVYRLAAGQL